MPIQRCLQYFSILCLITFQHTNAKAIQNELPREDFQMCTVAIASKTTHIISLDDFSEQVKQKLNQAKNMSNIHLLKRKYRYRSQELTTYPIEDEESTMTSTNTTETSIKMISQENGEGPHINLHNITTDNLVNQSDLRATKNLKDINEDIEKQNKISVCFGASTIYNKPPEKRWLGIKMIATDSWNRMGWRIWLRNRPVYIDLRKEMYTKGRSEECHTLKYSHWKDYIDCAMKRNQRLEYLIPRYPLHQIGYFYETKHPDY